MNSLFVRIYLDEDVSIVLARIVRARGYDVVTALDANMLGRTDEAQLECAAADGRAILTHNRDDFQQLATRYVQQGHSHAGIIIAVRRPMANTARRLLTLLDDITADEMRDQVRYI